MAGQPSLARGPAPAPPPVVAIRTGPTGTAGSAKRTWQLIIGGLGVLILLTVCGITSYFLLADDQNGLAGQSGGAAAEATALPRDISSRDIDPEPLTVAEVFPGKEIVINVEESAYQVLKTQASKDCKTATSGELNTLLAELDCSQVVRATLRSPTGIYLMTAGIFNLADATGAELAHDKTKSIVDSRTGGFQGLIAGRGTDALALPSAQVGWHVRGHYLVYCVIAKADGTPIGENDPFARESLANVIESYLRGRILENRATVPVNPSGPVALSAPPT